MAWAQPQAAHSLCQLLLFIRIPHRLLTAPGMHISNGQTNSTKNTFKKHKGETENQEWSPEAEITKRFCSLTTIWWPRQGFRPLEHGKLKLNPSRTLGVSIKRLRQELKTFSLMGQSVNNVGFLRLSCFCTTTQLTMHENHQAQMCEFQ